MRLSAPSISLTTVVALFYLSATSLSTEALPAAPLNQHSSLVSYAKHKVVRVSIPSKKVLGTLIKNEAFFQPDYFTHDMNIGGYVDMRIAPENFAKFKALKLKYKVLTNNLQPYLDQEHERDQRYQQQWEELKKSKVSRDGVMMNALSSSADWFSGYHTLQDSVNWLNAQAQSRASIASVFTAGKSVEGRDLTGIKIGSGPKTIVIIGESKKDMFMSRETGSPANKCLTFTFFFLFLESDAPTLVPRSSTCSRVDCNKRCPVHYRPIAFWNRHACC